MAGAGYKLFNTGDVLTAAQVNTYLMEQTVMVFADAAARTAALTGVVSEGMISYLKDTNAVEVYNGSAWVASDDPNAIQNTIVDAKGDLISATGNDVPARLAVGNNGETLLADSSATTGLRWQGIHSAGKNLVINGDFNIWQRGTTFTNPSFADYTADRFRNVNYNVAPTTYSISRQSFATADAPANMPESGYFFRSTLTTIGSTTVYDTCSQRIEGVMNSGATMTLSFYAKSDSTRTQSVVGVQNYGSGGSSEITSLASTNFTTTTTWQRFTFTFTINSTSGKTIGTSPYFYFFIRQACASGSVLDVTGVQLEYGSVATPFQTATGTLAGELAACQRYYWRYSASNGNPANYAFYGIGIGSTSTRAEIFVQYPVPMRISPTTLDYSNLSVRDGVNNVAVTASSINISNYNGMNLYADVASGLTANRPYTLFTNNSASGYLGVSAEL